MAKAKQTKTTQETKKVAQTLQPEFVGTLREKVFLDRYALKDKEGNLTEHTPEDTWHRVAWGIAQNEKPALRKTWEDKFYNLMNDFKFVPGGRILSGAGTNYQVTYFNCFVIPSPKDSREGILESLKQLVEIQSRSGGVGLNLSSLRPRGARVKKVNGTSSGPVTWAGLFSYATHDVVQQGGTRRGATMLMLWDWHPDVEEFITVKQDLSKINGANLSVCVSDAFMEAVKADRDWDLVYPDIDDPDYDKLWNGEIDQWKKLGKKVKVYKTVKARELWDLICTAAWRSAEPGLHFMERSNKRSNTYYFERLVATNPSLRAGTKVLTKQGVFPIEQLEGKKFLVKNLNGEWSEAECFLSGRNKQLYKITLSNGQEIFATPEHKWPVALRGGGFGKVTTNQLKEGHILPFPQVTDIDFDVKETLSKEEGFMVGWLYGDGWISDRNTPSLETEFVSVGSSIGTGGPGLSLQQTTPSLSLTHKERVFGFLFSEEDKILARLILPEINRLKREQSDIKKAGDNTYTIQTTSHEFQAHIQEMFGVDKKEKGLPSSVWTSGGDFIKGFIDGLISSDGFVSKNSHRVIFTTKHKRIAEDVSSLLSMYGIKSRVFRSEATKVKFPNQKEYSKTYERYDVQIDGYHAVNFAKLFKLSHPRKQVNLERIVATYKPSRAVPDEGLIRVKSVELSNVKEDVWDISVYDETHCFVINHVITGNCGEQPLGPWAVCNLGAMNLSAYVRNADLEHDKAGTFDYVAFGKDVRVAMRLLDNVIDQTYYFFKENEEIAKQIRRTGLGIMGLGDTLIKMKLAYGSEESLPVIHKIFETLRNNAYEASADIAKEKGAFPKFNKAKYLKGYHIQNLPKSLQAKIGKQGIRNAVLLTIAPTGTTSLVAGVSSGVEPVYEFSFLRRWRGGEDMVYHPLFDLWRKSHEGEDKPGYFVSANDLTPMEHVRVQAVAQEYIDSSISKTVNAPNAHTVEDVKTLYMAAYDYGLKGVTYMRDGSRQGVLERVDDKKNLPAGRQGEDAKSAEQPVQIPLPQIMPVVARPQKIDGSTYKTETPVGETFITINHTGDGQPFEVFITIGKSGSDVTAMAEGLARMISLNLRLSSTLPPRERMRQIVAMLTGIGGSRSVGFGVNRVRSLPDAVAKVLAQHFSFSVNGKVEDRTVINHVMADGVVPAAPAHDVSVVPAPETHVVHEVVEVPAEAVPVVASAGQQPMFAQTATKTNLYDICPECGVTAFAYEDGCKKCYSCGHSEC